MAKLIKNTIDPKGLMAPGVAFPITIPTEE
jgi:hypothetical protein